MNTIQWMALIISLMALLIVGGLLVLCSPSPREPRFLKALRYNMVAEYLAYLGYGLLNPHLLTYRASKAEKAMPLPGDELVTTANLGETYAITINAPVEKIWPWMVQMGGGKAFWYTWSPGHAFPEYKHLISTYRIHPEWQDLKVGDNVLDGDALEQCNENRGTWRVMELEKERCIVFFSARDFIDGFEFDPNSTRQKKIYGITSWIFYLQPLGESQSRLLIRVRAEVGPGLLKMVIRLVFGFGDAIFERMILDGIKNRVEQYGMV